MIKDNSEPTYRSQFLNENLAKDYDAKEYSPRSWSTLLWELEKRSLGQLLANPTFVPHRGRYLDFACGTGRVTSFIAPHFVESVGVDISEAMLIQARPRVPLATFVQGDCIADPALAAGAYDFVTSFRFVLNADPTDRLPALRWLRSRLRDDTSRAIVNNHSNLWTHKALTHSARRLKNRNPTVTGNILSHRQMVTLAHQAGFSVDSVHGMGLLGGQAMRIIPFGPMSRLQECLREMPVVEKLGEDQLYVLAPR